MFWDYCIEWVPRINNLTAKNLYQLRGQTPHTTVFGEEGDISVLGDFTFYEVVYYFDHKVAYPLAKERMGRYLGPSTGVGNEMCSWVLKTNGKVVARRTIRPLNTVEKTSEVEKEKIKAFDMTVKSLYGQYDTIPHEGVKTNHPLNQFEVEEDENFDSNLPEAEAPIDSSGRLFNQQPLYEKLVKAEVRMPHNGGMKNGKVIGRTIADDGRVYGTYDDNPYRNTVSYDMEFCDGEIKNYSASLIADNMYAQVDKEGYMYNLLDSILDHKYKKPSQRQQEVEINWLRLQEVGCYLFYGRME